MRAHRLPCGAVAALQGGGQLFQSGGLDRVLVGRPGQRRLQRQGARPLLLRRHLQGPHAVLRHLAVAAGRLQRGEEAQQGPAGLVRPGAQSPVPVRGASLRHGRVQRPRARRKDALLRRQRCSLAAQLGEGAAQAVQQGGVAVVAARSLGARSCKGGRGLLSLPPQHCNGAGVRLGCGSLARRSLSVPALVGGAVRLRRPHQACLVGVQRRDQCVQRLAVARSPLRRVLCSAAGRRRLGCKARHRLPAVRVAVARLARQALDVLVPRRQQVLVVLRIRGPQAADGGDLARRRLRVPAGGVQRCSEARRRLRRVCRALRRSRDFCILQGQQLPVANRCSLQGGGAAALLLQAAGEAAGPRSLGPEGVLGFPQGSCRGLGARRGLAPGRPRSRRVGGGR